MTKGVPLIATGRAIFQALQRISVAGGGGRGPASQEDGEFLAISSRELIIPIDPIIGWTRT